MSKPMIFKKDEAFNFLDENGFVFTFRKGRPDSIVENVWVRRSRTGKKEFDATKITVTYGANPFLGKYAKWSGFGGRVEWANAVFNLHGAGLIEGTIYLVFKNDRND